jgi:hypothetical protein
MPPIANATAKPTTTTDVRAYLEQVSRFCSCCARSQNEREIQAIVRILHGDVPRTLARFAMSLEGHQSASVPNSLDERTPQTDRAENSQTASAEGVR